MMVLVFSGALLTREASITEGLPFFLPREKDFHYLQLIEEGLDPQVHQFSDGLSLLGVIKMTKAQSDSILECTTDYSEEVRCGEKLEIVRKDRKIRIVRRGWMSAGLRMALAIPLHPDRMSLGDWQALPGIGATLAERIENDRHNNGDFVRLERLLRVKGIGEKRISRWRVFFGDS